MFILLQFQMQGRLIEENLFKRTSKIICILMFKDTRSMRLVKAHIALQLYFSDFDVVQIMRHARKLFSKF